MKNLNQNPYTTTAALIEGKTIKDVVLTTEGEGIVHNAVEVVQNDVALNKGIHEDYFAEDKCYLVIHGTEAVKMEVTTIDLERKIATFPVGMVPVGVKIIHEAGSQINEVTIIE